MNSAIRWTGATEWRRAGGSQSIVLVALIQASVAAESRSQPPIGIRELLASCRVQNAIVTVELADGNSVTGHIGHTQRTQFYVLDDRTRNGRAVAYVDI